MTKKNAASISDVLKSVVEALKKEKNSTKEEMDALWKRLVGEAGFKHSRPKTIRKKVLTVCVDSSVWVQNLSLKKRKILKGLKSGLGKDRISEIRFKSGEF